MVEKGGAEFARLLLGEHHCLLQLVLLDKTAQIEEPEQAQSLFQ
jgi:hypothetical protein